MKRWSILAAALCIFAGMVHAQASIDEGMESIKLYVDVVNGSDSNPGTKLQPFKTIGKSVSAAEVNNQNGIGTHVYINPGLYRENIDLQGTGQDTLLPETYEAETPGTVLISGADPYTNWTQYSGNSSIYSTPWTYNWGPCPRLAGDAPYEPDIHLRREMAFVNGFPLQQVLAIGQMLEGTFYVDDAGQQFYIWPPSGTNLNTADVELGDRPQLWAITNKNGVLLRGLTFEYSPDCNNHSAVEVNFGPNQNIEFDGDNFFWNDGYGLHLFNPLQHFTVKNVVANHNGDIGIFPWESEYGLFQNDTADFNNWRGEQAAYYGWGAEGLNVYGDAHDTYTNINTDWNVSTGTHWDTNNEDINVTNLSSRNNLYHGVIFERNDGPINATGLVLCNNANEALLANGSSTTAGGLALRDSENVTVTNSLVYGNGNSQFNVLGLAGGINILNWHTGLYFQVYTENFTNTNNIFESTDATQNTLRDSYLNGFDWNLFQTTLSSNNNTWWNPDTTASYVLPLPVTGYVTDFLGWQAASLQDLTSTFSQPSGNPQTQCQVAPDGPDLWAITTAPQLTLDPAGQATSTFTYLPIGGFGTTINLSMDGISEIAGATGTLSQMTIPNGSGSSVFTLTTTPSVAPGTYNFTILANGGSTTRASSALLFVPATGLRFSPSMTLNFGMVDVGKKSAPQTLTITNIGTKPVKNLVFPVAPVGFTYTKTCGLSLGAGKSCDVKITFAPNGGVPYNYPFPITDADPTSPQTVTLIGTGNAVTTLSFSKHTLTFDQVIWNTTATLSSVITNTGLVPAVFTSFEFSGSGAQYYTLQTNTCTGGLNPGDSCTLTVAFTPETLVMTSATLTIMVNVALGQETINMTGTGKTSVKIMPVTLLFGTHKVGSNTTKTVTFTNSGNPMDLSISLTGRNPNNFSYTTTCPGVVPTGSCTVNVTFTPLSKNSVTANLTFNDADPTSPQQVTLSGTGS